MPSFRVKRVERVLAEGPIERLGIFVQDRLDALGEFIPNSLHDVHWLAENQSRTSLCPA